jgi:hypothetical protein
MTMLTGSKMVLGPSGTKASGPECHGGFQKTTQLSEGHSFSITSVAPTLVQLTNSDPIIYLASNFILFRFLRSQAGHRETNRT